MSEELNSTDSTGLTNIEVEKKISSINLGNHFISNTYIDSKNEKDEFKEPEYEIQWNNFVQNSYHFKQDIERVWLITRCFDVLSLISNQGHYPCVFVKGQDTWKVGNLFKGNIYGVYPFLAKVYKSVNLPELKKIEWIFNILNKEYFIIRVELYKVTEDNTTVALKTVKYEEKKLSQKIKEEIIKYNEIRVFKHIEELLEKEPINLLKYESGIITGKMEDIWDIVLDFNKCSKIAPNNNYLPNINIKNIKVGEKIEVSALYNTEIRTFDFTLKCKEQKSGWNKWLFVCEVSGGSPKKIARHTVLFQLTKINNYECQLTLITKFHEPIDNNEFKELSNRKKYLLLSVKDYFENFYCPNISDEN